MRWNPEAPEATARHAPLEPRSPRAARARRLEVVGRCARCGVACVGAAADRSRLGAILAAHECCCPGGTRDGETWAPLAPAG